MDATSIDYGVKAEKCERILTIPIDVDWFDLGDWEAVGQHLPEIAGGTGMAAGAVAKDASGCVVHAPGQVVALLGVTDLGGREHERCYPGHAPRAGPRVLVRYRL